MLAAAAAAAAAVAILKCNVRATLSFIALRHSAASAFARFYLFSSAA